MDFVIEGDFMKSWRRFLFTIIPLLAIFTWILPCCLQHAAIWVNFELLKFYRKEPEAAAPIAAQLANTEYGVRLAIADMNEFGGHTRGWSESILLQSALTNTNAKLIETIENHDDTLPASKSIIAARLLWCRTEDYKYLKRYYMFLQPAGKTLVIERERQILASLCPDKLAMVLRVPMSESLNMTGEEFVDTFKRESKEHQGNPVGIRDRPLDDEITE